MKLYNITKGTKIYVHCTDGSKYVVFDHLDGMYSYCLSEKGAVCHLSAGTPLVKFADGYRIDNDDIKLSN